MNVATRLEASQAAQDVRRGDASISGGESFEIALEAQIAAAGIARAPSPLAEQDVERIRERKKVEPRSIDPTRLAEEKLVTRPQESELGLQSAVQAQMGSPDSKGPGEDSEIAEREVEPRSDKPHSRHEEVRAGRQTKESVKSQFGEERAREIPMQGNASDRGGQNQQDLPQNAAGASAPLATAQSVSESRGEIAAGSATAVSASAERSGAGGSRGGTVSAVDALGALGRKTAFKLQGLERPLTKGDADKFIAQASKALAAAVKHGGGAMVMRLNPENLGLLKVRIETKDGSLNAKVEASESSARELLTDNVEMLRSALEAHGVRVEKIEIVRMDDLQGTSSFHQPGTGLMSDGGHSQAEDRRESTERRDALFENQETSGLMDEPAGIYLHGVELRVDAIA